MGPQIKLIKRGNFLLWRSTTIFPDLVEYLNKVCFLSSKYKLETPNLMSPFLTEISPKKNLSVFLHEVVCSVNSIQIHRHFGPKKHQKESDGNPDL